MSGQTTLIGAIIGIIVGAILFVLLMKKWQASNDRNKVMNGLAFVFVISEESCLHRKYLSLEILSKRPTRVDLSKL